MATYRNPTYKPLEPAGTMPVAEALRMNQSIANQRSNPYPETKTSGIVTRGNGAATKGKTARGPMA